MELWLFSSYDIFLGIKSIKGVEVERNKFCYLVVLCIVIFLNCSKINRGCAELLSTPKEASTLSSINIEDKDLRETILKLIGQPTESELTQDQLDKVTILNLDNVSINSFKGLEYLSNLREIRTSLIKSNQTDLKYISSLKHLEILNLDAKYKGNLQNLVGIENLRNLRSISLQNQNLYDISEMGQVDGNIDTFKVSGNHLLDVSCLSNLAIRNLDLSNQIYIDSPVIVKQQEILKIPLHRIKNIDGSSPTIIPGKNCSLTSDGRFMLTQIDNNTETVEYSWVGNDTFSGSVKIPIIIKECSSQSPATSPSQSELPKWYAVISSNLSLNDNIKQGKLRVQLADPETPWWSPKWKPYKGEGSVAVKVRSENGFRLIDANHKDEPISYQFDEYGDGSKILTDDSKEEDLGRLDKNHTEFDSKVKVTGNATDGGTFVDVIHYRFTEE